MMRRYAKRWGSLLLLAAWALPIHAQEDLSALLDEYAQKADLSNQTKQEAGGNLIVYTRQDLERMQIKQLKELLEKLPFMRYKEDNFGLTNMFYRPYQPTFSMGIKLYLNDRALEIPYGGNALRVYAQIDLSFVDHVEIYLWAPSLSFGIQQGIVVIKLYTKDPAREEADVAGAIAGTYGTKDLYAYTAHTTESGIGYMVYANYMDLKRKRVRTPGGSLSRDKRIGHLLAEVKKGYHRVEMEAFRVKLDQFYGNSFRMDPVAGYPYAFATDLYGGYYYDNPETGWKGFVNYTVNQTDFHDKSRSSLGFLPSPGRPPHFFQSRHGRINDYMLDLQLRKRIEWQAWQNEAGVQFRHKKFDLPELSIDGAKIDSDDMEGREEIYSFFDEIGYQPDSNQIFLLSAKAEHYKENDRFNDRTQFFGRFGYIYNCEKWTFKTFMMAGDFIPDMRTLYENAHLFGVREKLDSTHAHAITGKLIRKEEWGNLSLLLAATEVQNMLYFNPLTGSNDAKIGYRTFDEPVRYYMAWLHGKRDLNENHTLEAGGWIARMQNKNLASMAIFSPFTPKTDTHMYGASISHNFVEGPWTLHNDLIYRYFEGYPRGLDWNLALTWRRDRHLTLFLKANNILDRALTNSYLAIDPRPIFSGKSKPVVTRLEDVDVFDQRVWIGMEYSF